MKSRKRSPLSFWQLLLVLIIGFSLSGCPIQIVSDYDSTTFEEIIKAGKKVDRFYGDLLETQAAARQYQKYVDRYMEIETDLRSLSRRNKARPLNEESTEISEIILNLWTKYKTQHAANNGYINGGAKLDRGRFIRLFLSAANAELAKKLDPEDKDLAKESKKLPPLGV